MMGTKRAVLKVAASDTLFTSNSNAKSRESNPTI